MSANPYQSPRHSGPVEPTVPVDAALRKRAKRRWQWAALILLIPTIHNLFLWEAMVRGMNGQPVSGPVRWANGIAIGIAFAAAGLLGPLLLEWLTDRIHRWFGSPATTVQWRRALYLTLNQSIPFALAGAVLWELWLIGFYLAKLEFLLISIPIGMLAHLLAAGLYLQLAYRWYRIEADANTE